MESLTSEQVDVLSAEATFRGALYRWIVETGTAIRWNSWQSGFALLRTRYEGRDVTATSGSLAFSTWCQSLWLELSEEVYGPDWRKLLKVGRVIPPLPQCGRLQGKQLARASGATAMGGLRPTAKAAPRPTPTSVQNRPGGLLPQGLDALGRVYTRHGPEGAAQTLRRPLPDGFSVSVPVREATRTSAERAAELPGRVPDAQLESGCKIALELYLLSQTIEVSADDRSEVAEQALEEWSQGLLLSGHSKEQVAAVLYIEWYIWNGTCVILLGLPSE